jgi:hypothetical protein
MIFFLILPLFLSALLHYSKDLQYSDAELKNVSWRGKLQEMGIGLKLMAAICVPSMKASCHSPTRDPIGKLWK